MGFPAGLLALISVGALLYPPITRGDSAQPIVAVKFLTLEANVDHNVECKINAANIATTDERDKFAGRVAFKIRVNRD
ncbi:hypothetical protein KIL84_020644 [Mauremys mutica]|uniref:Sodium/potassium-transporting ATPase subunit beta-2 n=1 Tax=Mauremys mutica TaxID=74926 RepID=A0A9D3WLI4_9SAUR|nr:hypothetical protein KIL84_020644 [Mauremys mutica]